MGTKLLGLLIGILITLVEDHVSFDKIPDAPEKDVELLLLLLLFLIEPLSSSLGQVAIGTVVPLTAFPDTNIFPFLCGTFGMVIDCLDSVWRFALVIVVPVRLVMAMLVLFVLPPVHFIKGTVADLVECAWRWSARWVITLKHRAKRPHHR